MQALDNQIISLTNQGLKAKAITEAVKKAGTRTVTGKVPTYNYIQSKIHALRKAGSFKGSNAKRQYNHSKRMAKGVNSPAVVGTNLYIQTILNANDLSDAKKVTVLKAWFA